MRKGSSNATVEIDLSGLELTLWTSGSAVLTDGVNTEPIEDAGEARGRWEDLGGDMAEFDSALMYLDAIR